MLIIIIFFYERTFNLTTFQGYDRVYILKLILERKGMFNAVVGPLNYWERVGALINDVYLLFHKPL